MASLTYDATVAFTHLRNAVHRAANTLATNTPTYDATTAMKQALDQLRGASTPTAPAVLVTAVSPDPTAESATTTTDDFANTTTVTTEYQVQAN